MTDLTVIKSANGGFIPADQASIEAARKFKTGQPVRAKFTRQRNYEHHKKWFALAGFAYDHWEPSELQDSRFEGVTPEKNFDRFRKDLIILAGYYDASYRIDGSVRVEAKSISFGSMSQDDFDRLYSATIDAVLKHILRNYTRDDLEQVVEQLLRFD